MSNTKSIHTISNGCVVLFMIGMFFYGNTDMFNIICIGLYAAAVLRALGVPSAKKFKLVMIASYSFFLPVQIMINKGIVDSGPVLSMEYLNSRIMCLIGITLPFIIERFFIINQYAAFYMPSLQDLSIFSLNELMHGRERIYATLSEMQKTGEAFSPDNMKKLAADLPRHNSFRYVNNGTLTDDYFKEAYASVDDPYIYIVISNTGSAASEVISVFTKRKFNHASMSFDIDLKTIISYNGGDRVYPPGLNHEMLEYFNQKSDASIMIYALEASPESKRIIIDKIRDINLEGSAYNVMGLVFKYSYKGNIMFCSQFVYKMLKYAGIHYFDKPDGWVNPSDFVELDYYRKLQYVREIKFSDN